MKNRLRLNSFIISFLIVTAVFFAYSVGKFGIFNNKFHFFENFENKSLDWRFRLRGMQKPQSPIVIAKIDDAALENIGKWPWPRRVHAKLADICRRAGAKALVFDVLFLDPDRYDPTNDTALAQSMKRYGKVISSFNFNFVTEPEAQGNDEAGNTIYRKDFVIKEDPVEKIKKASRAVGFVNAWPDSDGSIRSSALSFEFEGKTYYPINVQAVALVRDEPPEKIVERARAFDSEEWGSPMKKVLVNWRGSEIDTYESYSCSALFGATDEWLEKWLKDKIVLVGSTAIGLYDHYPTPFSPAFPGLYLHANVIDNLWTSLWVNDFLKPVSPWVTVFFIFLFGILSGVVIPRWTAAWSAVFSLGIAALFWVAGYFLMTKKLYYLELVAPTVSLLGSYITVFFYRFIVEQREKAGIKKAFGVYVNPHVVDEIAKNPDALKLGGEQREMTVMFSDVAGFTTISEKLSPQELVQLLNLYLTAMTDTIMKFDGTVDKYEGDAVMAFWGAPLLQPRHARQACIAVLENRERLKELNVELEKKGMQQLAARCGLNSGLMNVGNMGSSQKFNYTVMGDSVNLASRLEGANKQYGTMLMVSESTYAAAKDDIEVRELDLLRVKGKNVPIKVYELLSKKGELSDGQKKAFEIYDGALELYRKKQFKKAMSKFEEVGGILKEDGPSKTYIHRCKDYIETPPPEGWDGVFVMTTK